MRPAFDRSTSHVVRLAFISLAVILVAACGGSTTASSSAAPSTAPTPSPVPSESAPPSVAPTPTPTPTAVPTEGPAALNISLTGTSGLTGAIKQTSIVCGQPSFDGPQLFALATSGPIVGVVLFVTAAKVEVRVATGSGATLKLRSFAGTGVSNFGGLTGATIDSPLTEITPAGAAVGDLGSLSAISGTIDCGNQGVGSSTIVVTGDTKFGTLDGVLTAIHVTCTTTASSGRFVTVHGLSMAGTTPVLIFVTIGSASLQASVQTRTAGSFFNPTGLTVTKATSTGGKATGDVIESDAAAGATVHKLHIVGDATCGTLSGS